ncbi:glycosyltransferase [Marinobacter sp. TBZ242]|uniref:Glycosyltransferase n=1 Tax=Marinobacter azerbaijanicus TaxID=3050455 RepID=A0ABT7I6G7_9GAMM|nr:glycosyltransferase [Marinobacter sp. TBZ242]MDL0429711.1 glycosyltransferase [Marinobacter sp. TBZ242]
MESKHKLVSVVIPSYNRARYIDYAVSSVLTQSYRPLQLIVVDDGSKDGSYEKLASYKAQGLVELLTHPDRQNLGQSASLNLGIRKAKGEYVAILDSDDLFSEGKISSQLKFLEENPDIGMVYGQGHAISADGDFLFKVPDDGHKEKSDPNRLLLDCYMALPGGALIRKSVLEQVGPFEEAFRAGQDHDMALRIMEATKVAYLPELAFYYRKHGDSISSKGLERRWKTGMEILRRAAERYPYKKSTLRKRRAVLHFRLGQTYWRESGRLKAIRHLFIAGVLDPLRAIGVVLGRERA